MPGERRDCGTRRRSWRRIGYLPGMRILGSTHVIAVPDLAASSAFYRDVLGFQVEGIGGPGWRLFVKDACRIMAGECRDATPPRETGDHSYFLYLVVDVWTRPMRASLRWARRSRNRLATRRGGCVSSAFARSMVTESSSVSGSAEDRPASSTWLLPTA